MKFMFKDDGARTDDGAAVPCTVFGAIFPAGVWIENPPITAAQALKLFHNPAFESEGGDVLAGLTPGAFGEAARSETAGPVEIPEGWEKLHWMKRRAIAAQLDPAADGEKADVADAIVRAELAKRAAEPEPDLSEADDA